jgi:hypothetical protein
MAAAGWTGVMDLSLSPRLERAGTVAMARKPDVPPEPAQTRTRR